jgi:hypothetical protein
MLLSRQCISLGGLLEHAVALPSADDYIGDPAYGEP